MQWEVLQQLRVHHPTSKALTAKSLAYLRGMMSLYESHDGDGASVGVEHASSRSHSVRLFPHVKSVDQVLAASVILL